MNALAPFALFSTFRSLARLNWTNAFIFIFNTNCYFRGNCFRIFFFSSLVCGFLNFVNVSMGLGQWRLYGFSVTISFFCAYTKVDTSNTENNWNGNGDGRQNEKTIERVRTTQRQVDGSTIRRSMINRDIHLNNVLFPRRRSNNKIIINNRFPLAEWNVRRTKQKLITEKEAKRKEIVVDL